MTSKSSRHPQLQENLEFYRRVLNRLPTPVIVLDATGAVMYCNDAILELTGWTADEVLGESLFQYLHPDDAPWVLESFAHLLESAEEDTRLGAGEWSSLRLRVLATDGTAIPVEATGGGGLADPTVGGSMYTVRPAGIEELLDDVFVGVATGDSIESLMERVVALVTQPPLGLDAAVFEQRADGSDRLVATSHPGFEGLPVSCTAAVPWAGLSTEAAFVDIGTLPTSARSRLLDAGFGACYHAGAHAPDVSTTLRLIACKAKPHQPPAGVLQRIDRARKLMSIVLLKAHNDRLLEHAATLDDLTGLPNRLGLNRCLRRVETGTDECAMLFVDIDGFKSVNDRHGHLVGDRVLATVADRLRRAVRAGDVVTRLYGDEFAVLLLGATGDLTPDTVRRIASRTVKMLAEPLQIDGLTVKVSASVGAAYLDGERNVDQLMGQADEAMYTAKRAGGDRHHVASVQAA